MDVCVCERKIIIDRKSKKKKNHRQLRKSGNERRKEGGTERISLRKRDLAK